MDELFGCLDWVAPGFEIVQSHQLDWKFEVADTVERAVGPDLHAQQPVIEDYGPVRDLRQDTALSLR